MYRLSFSILLSVFCFGFSPIDSGSGAGQVIYTIEATDNVGVSSYRIAYGDAADFSVNPSTGEVTLLENPDYEFKSSYHFEARAEDAVGNMTSLNVSLEINQALDLADVNTSRVFYTNPVWDQLEIRSESIVESVALYSLTGRRVFERKPNVTALSLDISSLAQGIYLMKVKTTTHQTTLKLVKQ